MVQEARGDKMKTIKQRLFSNDFFQMSVQIIAMFTIWSMCENFVLKTFGLKELGVLGFVLFLFISWAYIIKPIAESLDKYFDKFRE